MAKRRVALGALLAVSGCIHPTYNALFLELRAVELRQSAPGESVLQVTLNHSNSFNAESRLSDLTITVRLGDMPPVAGTYDRPIVAPSMSDVLLPLELKVPALKPGLSEIGYHVQATARWHVSPLFGAGINQHSSFGWHGTLRRSLDTPEVLADRPTKEQRYLPKDVGDEGFSSIRD